MKLFVDTSAWVAFYAQNDQKHQEAASLFDGLSDQKGVLYTTDYIVDETVTLLLYRSGRASAIKFFESLQQNRQIKLLHIDDTVWLKAWQLFRQYDDKMWAFTDCTSFVVMRELVLQYALSFDHHFTQAGFVLWRP